MLQITNVSKTYKTGPLVQQALDGVSLNLRDSEFVAILGPSGSGKTTLLNVIGGLDRYDQGDLIINGVSTKKYNARDWDAYRNHSVGFVFQSYNLIPHQTVLANVELALTIGGISKKERTRRARQALESVGLKDHMHKRPSQLSGGQMQRVAIARALVNDPDILLADEPTGALDSETSLQVMDLLQQVAKDRLVVMVTHNPELAERYATRTVRLKDGRIVGDTDPFDPAAEEGVHRRVGKASMSFLTALSLSFNNLWTKKVRTLLVAFAGSIGIIGIAMILSMSNGVDRYIQNVQEDTLKSYPLQITDASFDLSLFMPNEEDGQGGKGSGKKAEVRERRTVTSFFSKVAVNDLASLRGYLESGKTDVYDHVQAIEYSYNLTPQIFLLQNGQARQVNPDRSLTAIGLGSADGMSGLLTAMSSTDTFHAMPAKRSLYEDQYDVKAGHWPEKWNECVLVLSSGGRVTDLSLYTMGMKDPKELEEMVRRFAEGGVVPDLGEEASYRYKDFLGIEFRLVNAADYYAFDTDYGVWADRSSDPAFLNALASRGEKLTIVGVVQAKEDSTSPTLSTGIGYPAELIDHLMTAAAKSPIVLAQQRDPETDVFTGKRFDAEPEARELDLASLFEVDEEALRNALGFGEDDLSGLDFSDMDFSDLDLTDSMDPNAFASAMPSLSEKDLAYLLQGVKIQLDAEDLKDLFTQLAAGYLTYASGDPTADPTRLAGGIRDYLASDAAREILSRELSAALAENGAAVITREELTDLVAEIMAGYPAYLAEQGIEEEEMPMAYLGAYLQSEAARQIIDRAVGDLQDRVAAFQLTPEQTEKIASALLAGYDAYAADNGLPSPASLLTAFTEYLSTPGASELIARAVADAVDTSGLESRAAKLMAGYTAGFASAMSTAMERMMQSVADNLGSALQEKFSSFGEDMAERFESALQPGEDGSSPFAMKLSPEELRDLMTTLLSTQSGSYEGNLRKLGWTDRDHPSAITIYPTDFEGKKAVKRILEDYNEQMRRAGEDDKVITYTDVVDTLMSSVTKIVDAISAVLIAFVAISLVVSSVMIGVITYISVLERRKEIGILRAIGASKRNVSQVFNAETFIIGALAGLLGIGITYLLLIPANRIIASVAEGVKIRAYLPVTSALILVALSIGLTLLGGLIPSRKAAKSDPVAALRAE